MPGPELTSKNTRVGVQHQNKLLDVEDVLKAASKVDFSNKRETKKFVEQFKDFVGGTGSKKDQTAKGASTTRPPLNGKVFHKLAEEPALFDQYKDFIEWAFGRKYMYRLLGCKTNKGDTPLHLAIEYNNHEFVRLALEKLVDKVTREPEKADAITTVLTRADQVGLTCLHKAISNASPFTEAIISILLDLVQQTSMGSQKHREANESDSGSESDIEMTTSKLHKLDDVFTLQSQCLGNTKGWTALHYAVQICAEDHQQRATEEEYRENIERRAKQQPTSEPLRPDKKPATNGPQAVVGQTSSSSTDSNGERTGPWHSAVQIGGSKNVEPIASKKPGKEAGSDVSNGTNGAPPNGNIEAGRVHVRRRDYCQLTIIQELIKANPRALIIEDEKCRTPFQLRLELKTQQKQEEARQREEEARQRKQEQQARERAAVEQEIRQPLGGQSIGMKGGGARRSGVEEGEDEEFDEETDEGDEGEDQNETDEEENEDDTDEEEDDDEQGAGTRQNNDQHNDEYSSRGWGASDTIGANKGTSARQFEDFSSHDYKQEVQLANEDGVLRWIREYVIDNFDRRAAMKALYRVGYERTIEFDLTGLPYESINKDLLGRLGNVLHFEGRLKYVALPRLTVANDAEEISEVIGVNDQGQQNMIVERQGKPKPKARGLQHMCTIFHWLKELHVKSVMKVTVMDEGKFSHSDEAIERCMGGLEVKVWNWRRVDLCIDVIANSAPNVTDVTLYSSGNNAVFVGWSSIGGLPKLKKLKKVRIFVKDSLETPTRLQEYQKRFKQELLGHRPDLKIYWPTQDRSVFEGSSPVKTSGEPKWIRTMKQFAEFLRSARPKAPVTPVKIAIIDDGIDSTQKIFTDRIQTGESFYAAGSRWKGAYYVPTGSHGTLMAQLICAVCPAPVAKLYIAQLEPVPRNDGRRGFTPQSAIEAIEWAVNRGVDIISMSWSIDLDPESSDINRLKSALDRARAQNIVMFCSSIDEGPVGDDNTYPGKEASCIKIGASTGDGSRLSWVSAKSSDFLLPGDESVHFSLRENMQSTSASRRAGYGSEVPPGGSSISTALAAGLAGVVMFCDRLVHSSDGPSFGSNYFQNPAVMRRAFTIMAAKSDDKNFPRVWRFIPSHWERPLPPDEANSRGGKAEKRELKWNEDAYPEDTEETKKQLMKFLNKLKPDDKDE